MLFKSIDHVEIVADQLDRTVKFYTEVLGFTVKAQDRIERWVYLTSDEVVLPSISIEMPVRLPPCRRIQNSGAECPQRVEGLKRSRGNWWQDVE